MAGEIAKESVFESRLLIDLYRTLNMAEQPQKAEAYLEQAHLSMIEACGSEDHPAMLNYYFVKMEQLINYLHENPDADVQILADCYQKNQDLSYRTN